MIRLFHQKGSVMSMQNQAKHFILKDPGSAITHFIALIFTMVGGVPLLLKAAEVQEPIRQFSVLVYVMSMMLLYLASTMYHSFDISETVNRRLKKFDHMMISVLIAGSYTPICLISLRESVGIPLFFLIWTMALAGILLKAMWVYCPKWLSSIIYIAMGWTCVFAFVPLLHALPIQGFLWLLFGGIIYTIGGVIYALKLPIFHNLSENFGNHEIFHLFVMGGSFCHFVVMYVYVY